MSALHAARAALAQMHTGPFPVKASDEAWAEAARRGWIRSVPAIAEHPQGWMICTPGYDELDRLEQRKGRAR